MHELSLATALVELVRQHAPAGSTVKVVRLRAGPLRGVEPLAMEWAWQSATMGTDLADSRIEIELPPWKLHCPDCGREWEQQDMVGQCACGCPVPYPVGGDELQLLSLTVDEPATAQE